MKRWLLALPFFVFLTACSVQPTGELVDIYFCPIQPNQPALVAEQRTLRDTSDPMAQLIATLLTGPLSDQLYSPIPAGVTLQQTQLNDDGILTIDLSESYSSLSGMSLTLADCAFALTLCQMDAINAVSVTVDGLPISFRDKQTLTADDVILYLQETEPTS